MLSAAVLSLVIIVLAHYILAFLKSTLTVPLVRDLAVGPGQERAKLQALAHAPLPGATTSMAQCEDRAKMRAELRTFIGELKRNNTSATAPQSANLQNNLASAR